MFPVEAFQRTVEKFVAIVTPLRIVDVIFAAFFETAMSISSNRFATSQFLLDCNRS